MWLSVFAIFFVTSAQSAKILGIFPMPGGRSHYILGSALMRELAERGHDVTVISLYGEKTPPKNGTYRDIVLEGIAEEEEKHRSKMNIFEEGNILSLFTFKSFHRNRMIELTERTFANKDVQKLIDSDEKFDAVIVEEFQNDAHKAFATHFKAPLILFTTLGANSWINLLVGNPEPLSYVPDTFLGFSSDMTFLQRTVNSLTYLHNLCWKHLTTWPQHDQLIKKYIPNGPNINEVLYNASIVLVNSHPSFNQPVPYVPNMIDIGGFHIRPPQKLPEDLKGFLNSAKNGVIYFSLGSNLKSVNLPQKKLDIFLKSFSKLKQKVLWKFENDSLPGQSPNVKLMKWLPQQDLLAHSNIKLFITQGGILSTLETIYHGVPVLALPAVADQVLNSRRMVNQGLGLWLKFSELSEEVLTSTLEELLNNHKYSNNAKKASKLFHDRIVHPMDIAIYWVEYVIRHKGAPHLRVASLDLPWYKYYLLDVIFVLSTVTLLFIYVLFIACKKIVQLTCTQRKLKVKMN